ncbi:MAG: hypothetical protein DSY76_01820 [Bacteroidetes bacterium]|nr:MAG: hypothetical protein DSY76_01820 [Bacteroidota bacterium]
MSKKDNIKPLHKSDKQSFFTRRSFVKTSLAASILSVIPFTSSCLTKVETDDKTVLLDGEEYQIDLNFIRAVQNILFPKDELGPGAVELKSDTYLLWTLNDQRLDPWDGEQILKGFTRLDKTSNTKFNKSFINLSQTQQEELIASISLIDWGQTWLSRMLTIIFESMYANPNYGSNPDEIGWKWVHHQAGFPQPNKDQIYPAILSIVKQKSNS